MSRFIKGTMDHDGDGRMGGSNKETVMAKNEDKIENVGTGDGPAAVSPATAAPAVDNAAIARIQGVSPEDTERLRDRARAGLGLTDAAASLPEAIVTGPGEKEAKK